MQKIANLSPTLQSEKPKQQQRTRICHSGKKGKALSVYYVCVCVMAGIHNICTYTSMYLHVCKLLSERAEWVYVHAESEQRAGPEWGEALRLFGLSECWSCYAHAYQINVPMCNNGIQIELFTY